MSKGGTGTYFSSDCQNVDASSMRLVMLKCLYKLDLILYSELAVFHPLTLYRQPNSKCKMIHKSMSCKLELIMNLGSSYHIIIWLKTPINNQSRVEFFSVVQDIALSLQRRC